jgi:hypothetical protein
MNETLLSNQEHIVLEQMCDGIYLLKTKDGEGLGWHYDISTIVPKGTVSKLLETELIRESFAGKRYTKYTLTDKGRKFKKIK